MVPCLSDRNRVILNNGLRLYPSKEEPTPPPPPPLLKRLHYRFTASDSGPLGVSNGMANIGVSLHGLQGSQGSMIGRLSLHNFRVGVLTDGHCVKDS